MALKSQTSGCAGLPVGTSKGRVVNGQTFRSGSWTGFYRYGWILLKRKVSMQLTLQFHEGQIEGDGKDPVGAFDIAGSYSLPSMEVRFVKTYQGRHSVEYSGKLEGVELRGRWQIAGQLSGEFSLWPDGAHEGIPGILRV